MDISIQKIRDGFEQYIYELEKEMLPHRAGKTTEIDTAKITEKFKWLGDLETIEFLKQEVEKHPEKANSLKKLYFGSVEIHAEAGIAKDEDALQKFISEAKVQIPGGEEIAYHDVRKYTNKEPDFHKREHIYFASLPTTIKACEMQKRIFQKSTALIHKITGLGYIRYCQKRKKMDYSHFLEKLRKAHEALWSLYQKIMEGLCQRELGLSFHNLHPCHGMQIICQDDNSEYFPKENILPVLEQAHEQLGIDYLANGRIKFDVKDRPSKDPRACCFTIRIPGETEILIKPRNSLNSFSTGFHEEWHALHHENTPPDLPYEQRGLPESNAYTETCAYLGEHITEEVEFLKRFCNVPEDEAYKFRYQQMTLNLMMFFRYIGKLEAEYEYFSKGDPDDYSAYGKHLTEKTEFLYDSSRFMMDLDFMFYTADYLKAWVACAQITDYLRTNFGETWFLNPNSKYFFLRMWGNGAKMHIDEFCRELGYDPYDLSYLVKHFTELENYVSMI